MRSPTGLLLLGKFNLRIRQEVQARLTQPRNCMLHQRSKDISVTFAKSSLDLRMMDSKASLLHLRHYLVRSGNFGGSAKEV